MMGPYGYGFGMHGSGLLLQLVILLVFIAVVFWLLRQNQQFGYRSSESAEDILKKRLARGDIDEKEYRRLKKEITT